MEKFWTLRPLSEELGLSKVVEAYHASQLTELCSVNPRHGRMPIFRSPNALEIGRGSLGNLSLTQYEKLVIDEKTFRLLQRSPLSGFSLSKATITASSDFSRNAYWVDVNGWAGLVSQEAGIDLDSDPCSKCGRVRFTWKRSGAKLIDRNQWDGADVFRIWPLSTLIFVSERFRQLVDHHRLAGITFLAEEELFTRNKHNFVTYGIGGVDPRWFLKPTLAEERRSELRLAIESRRQSMAMRSPETIHPP